MPALLKTPQEPDTGETNNMMGLEFGLPFLMKTWKHFLDFYVIRELFLGWIAMGDNSGNS